VGAIDPLLRSNDTILSHVQGRLRLKQRGSGPRSGPKMEMESTPVEIPTSNYVFRKTSSANRRCCIFGYQSMSIRLSDRLSTEARKSRRLCTQVAMVNHVLQRTQSAQSALIGRLESHAHQGEPYNTKVDNKNGNLETKTSSNHLWQSQTTNIFNIQHFSKRLRSFHRSIV